MQCCTPLKEKPYRRRMKAKATSGMRKKVGIRERQRALAGCLSSDEPIVSDGEESAEFPVSIDSSVHASDYSRSDEESGIAAVESAGMNHRSLHRAKSASTPSVSVESSMLSSSSESSFSGSPWTDGTDEDTYSSESQLSSLLSAESDPRYAEARARMTKKQLRVKPPHIRRSNSSDSTIVSGNDPARPIDVTGRYELPMKTRASRIQPLQEFKPPQSTSTTTTANFIR
jgi:hypothetical protein